MQESGDGVKEEAGRRGKEEEGRRGEETAGGLSAPIDAALFLSLYPPLAFPQYGSDRMHEH